MKLDLPEPETPVMATNLPSGILQVTFDSVWIRAPTTVSWASFGLTASCGRCTKACDIFEISRLGEPWLTIRPPLSPGPGPSSRT